MQTVINSWTRDDLIALEDIRQYSVVYREGNGVRYLNPKDDLSKMEAYFVNQCFPIPDSINELTIPKGTPLLLFKVSLMFGLIG